MQSSRRAVLKTAGAAGTMSLFSGTAAAWQRTVDNDLDVGGGVQEVLVTFDRQENVSVLDHYDLVDGYHAFSEFPVAYARMTGEQIRRVGDLSTVWSVEPNHDIEYHNDDAREVTGVAEVQADLFYTGESVHAAVIDSGIDGDHPDFSDSLQHNYRFADPLNSEEPMWTDVGPANTGGTGHGTHCSGSIAGEGTQSDGEYRGMAPDADLTVYSTTGGAVLLQIVGAYNHLVRHQREGRHDIQVVNNSYGPVSGNDADYSPNAALNVATYEAFQEGMVPVFSAGNSGPDPNTLSNYGKAPHVLASAATNDAMEPTNFTSRGRKASRWADPTKANYDRVEAFENQRTFYEQTELENLTEVGDPRSASGTAAPGGSTIYGPDTGQSQYFDLSPGEAYPGGADQGFVRAELTWDRQTDDLDLFLLEGGEDGDPVASSTQGTGVTTESIKATIDLSKEYVLEVDPFRSTGVSFDLSWQYYEVPETDPPYGVYRPSVGTPGDFVMSTLAPTDPLQGYGVIQQNAGAQADSAQEPYYGKLSGTSMSGPVLCGICALVYDAYFQNHGEWPDPMDVIVTVEATARDVLNEYTTWNIGAGFADAEAAVSLAERGTLVTAEQYEGWVDLTGGIADGADDPDGAFRVEGERTDDGRRFVNGAENQVTLTVDPSRTARVRDRIPRDWEVVRGDHDRVYTEAGAHYIEFDEVAGGGVSYTVKAPQQTGTAEFGPAEAAPEPDNNDDPRPGSFHEFTGVDTNVTVGASTPASGP